MSSRPIANFHLPLSPELHEMLRDEAELSGQPATAVAREVLETGLAQRRKLRLHHEIAAWASAHAGTDLDLDRNLEQAGIESIEAEPS